MTGPGHDEEIENFGTRCKQCLGIIGYPFDPSPDDYELCIRCWKENQATLPVSGQPKE